MNTGQACEDCMWGVPSGDMIECHVGPRVWCHGEYSGWWAFPEMDPSDWCKDFLQQTEENQSKWEGLIPIRGE